MNSDKPIIWLCDLTYTQQTISSDVMPAAIASIATYTKKTLKNNPIIKLFKFPEKLSEELDKGELPDVIGFSNYIWNRNLSSSYAKIIKKKYPEIITVMGGPNYPTNIIEQEEFVRNHPMIDYFIVKEGEVAFAKLIEFLCYSKMGSDGVPHDVPSIHCIDNNGSFYTSKTTERIMNMEEIPSPYLEGMLDEYFDGKMLPIIQTNRGCPFKCTFCVEGDKYYSRVAKSKERRSHLEVEFISKRMSKLIDEGVARSDLHIADSNFGMFKEDIELCKTISDMQKQYNYPKYISVATGKNHKERVLEAAGILDGALRLSGSVQSLNKQVLDNIERSNINENEILDLALSAREIGANSYSEIILGLPGDNISAHLSTIRTIIEADFNTIALYQLMLLPGTDLASRESIKKWNMVTKYRVLPRCFGYFDVLGKEVNSAEIEEVCVSNDSLNFSEYLLCRHMHLIINVFYNDGAFIEILHLLKSLGISKYQWIESIWKYDGNNAFNNFVDDFLKETENELWDDKEQFSEYLNNRENIIAYVNGEFGHNLIFKYKSLCLVKFQDELADVALKTLIPILEKENVSEEEVTFAKELIEYSRLRMSNIFQNNDEIYYGFFDFDVIGYSNELNSTFEIARYKLSEKMKCRFELKDEQKETVANYISIYGDSVMGISRILSKVYVRKLYRHVEIDGNDVSGGTNNLSDQQSVIGDGQLSGLNEFG